MKQHNKKKGKKARRWIGRFIKGFFLAFFALVVMFGIFFAIKFVPVATEYSEDAKNIVAASTEDTFKSQLTTYIYDANGKELVKLKGDKDIIYKESSEIPDYVKEAFVSVEDRKFYDHKGIDLKGIVRILYRFVVTKGDERHGASTITQQLARNVFLSHEVSIERKLKEMFIALELEKKYTKDELLEYYINSIYFANGYYGIGAAAVGYFNKDISQCSVSEVAFLCAIPNNPTLYDPVEHFDNVLKRRDKILKDMKEMGYLSEAECNEAKLETITLNRHQVEAESDYMTSYAIDCAVRVLMEMDNFAFRYDFASEEDYDAYNEDYGEAYNAAKYKLVTGGYRIYTSLDGEVQQLVQQQIDETLSFNTEEENGLLSLQGAATVIDNRTGRVIALVGGRSEQDGLQSGALNRAYQSHRQPGSSFKPLVVYTPAFMSGYTPDSIVDDKKIKDGPSNSNGNYSGKISVRYAVEQSKNVVAWNLFEELEPSNGLKYVKDMQFSQIVKQDETLASALGGLTYGVTTVEMAGAYCTLVNNGIYREPTCIVSMADKDNKELYEFDEGVQVYSSLASQAMIDVLEGVITKGTAKNIGWKNSLMVAAGKTGTTNDNTNGWFCGVTPYYTVTTWVGYDTPKKLKGLSGASYPADIWVGIQKELNQDLPEKEFDKTDYIAGGGKTGSQLDKENKQKKEKEQKKKDTNAKYKEKVNSYIQKIKKLKSGKEEKADSYYDKAWDYLNKITDKDIAEKLEKKLEKAYEDYYQ